MACTRLLTALFAIILMAASSAPASSADALTFTGTVTYRERVSLPSDAELWISLVSLNDGAVIVSAEADITHPARMPLDFVFDVRSSTIGSAGHFGLIAEIRVHGAPLLRNTTPAPVDLAALAPHQITISVTPLPHPDPVPDMAPAFEELDEVELLDTLWKVTSIGGDPVLPSTTLTLAIAADLRAGGHGGCNNYFTEADFITTPIGFGPIAGTRMACANDVMAQEARLFAALQATQGYATAGQSLQLHDAAGVTLIGLVRAP